MEFIESVNLNELFEKVNLKISKVDKLIESIILQAEILDLKTNFESKATGVVLESKIL